VPRHGSVLFTVIREAGFPAASLREGPRLATWLKRSVLAIDAGSAPDEAVTAESWRAGETLVQALYEPAVALCRFVAQLRARLPEGLGASIDPVQRLDVISPQWRSELPFDLEEQDVRLLVEDLVRVRRGDAEGLTTTRHLRRSGPAWTATAELLISGSVEHRRLPADVRSALADAGRVRLRPGAMLAEFGRPIVAMERAREDENDRWELRPLVQGFEALLPLGEELRVIAIAGEATLGEFTAFAGEPLRGPVVALQPTTQVDPSETIELEVLGTSPVTSTRPWLALAIELSEVGRVRFENTPMDLGRSTAGDRRIMAFTGRAELDVGGAVLVWRTGAQEDRNLKLVLVGQTVHRVREQIFQGKPQAWLVESDLTTLVQARDVQWRFIGSRDWRTTIGQDPLGRVEFAVRRQGQLVAWSRAEVAPSAFGMVAEVRTRQLHLTGLKGATVTASGDGPLHVIAGGETAVIDLSRHRPGGSVRLSLRWATAIEMTLPDPVAESMLLDPSGRTVSRAHLAIGRFAGFRLLSPEPRRLCFELRRSGHAPLHATRAVEGLTPLTAFRDLVREMTGGSPDLDATVRLTWIGHGNWLAEAGLYDLDQPLTLPEGGGAFASLSGALQIMHLKGFSLSFPGAGIAEQLPFASASEIRARLQENLGDGPWLLLGTTADGLRLRPKVLTSDADTAAPSTPLAAAIREPTRGVRDRSLDACLDRPEELTEADRRLLVDLCVTARNVEAPYASVDALRALCRAPRAAPFVLATCDSLAEREAVLQLQGELPLLWFITPIEAWISAFGQRSGMLARRLSDLDLPTSLALATTAKALTQIVDLQPGLRMHAQTTFLLRYSSVDLDQAIVNILCRRTERTLLELANDFVRRCVDVADPPALPGLLQLQTEPEPLWKRFDDAFAGIIAAPNIAARIAVGQLRAQRWVVDACRTAWLYDRDYFEGALVRTLQEMSSRSGYRPPHA
jgi:hypothetical protein